MFLVTVVSMELVLFDGVFGLLAFGGSEASLRAFAPRLTSQREREREGGDIITLRMQGGPETR